MLWLATSWGFFNQWVSSRCVRYHYPNQNYAFSFWGSNQLLMVLKELSCDVNMEIEAR